MVRIKRSLLFLVGISQPVWLPALVFIGAVISVIMDFIGTVTLGIVLALVLLRAPKEEVR